MAVSAFFRIFALQSIPAAMSAHQLNIAIFASGNGTNAENIIRYFNTGDSHPSGMTVSLVVASRPDAYVIERARRLGVPVRVIDRATLNDPDLILPLLRQYGVDVIILAGFLMMIPQFLIRRYPEKIINIHPSLLPRHGGKGMYGRNVHEAVLRSGDTRTGITIHFVSEEYDRGRIIFQTSVDVEPGDTVDDIGSKVQLLEQQHFPRVIHETFAS